MEGSNLNSSKRAQTATEYLIILAVVIVIALIVVGVLGGIPSIGGGANKNALDAQMKTEKVGIDNYYVNATSAKILLRNNQPDTVTVNKLTIDTMICSPATSDGLPAQLRAGQTKTVTCTGDFTSHATGRTAPVIGVDYTELNTDANYLTPKYEEFDYSGFDEIVINSTYHHMWQAGDSGVTLAWATGGTETLGETCSNRGAQTSYPACEYCEALALCQNGSFDATGSCSGAYGGILHSDWRLPSGDTPYTAGLDYSYYESAITGGSYFTNASLFTQNAYYWTGTSFNAGNAYVALLDFDVVSGGIKDNGGTNRARCVRDHD